MTSQSTETPPTVQALPGLGLDPWARVRYLEGCIRDVIVVLGYGLPSRWKDAARRHLERVLEEAAR